ncbi:MAG: glucose 1-dehydrogenase [Planctomycetes bacterium]|nr:glucose 1-dehydrogenase [Planctomycetota bacterium]
MKLQNKVALVTGGGTGIGRACTLALAREGAAVIVNYSRSRDDAEQTALEARGRGARALAVQASVASDSEIRALMERVESEFGRLDILVNNAGTTSFVPHEDLDGLTEEKWDEVMAVNVKGAFFASRAAVKLMLRNDGGSIVNVASIAGTTGLGSSVAYCASKAAMLSITKSLARVLAPRIRVNSVSPGLVMTRWVSGWDRFIEANVRATPMQRAAQPEDIADAVVFLSTGTSFITGQNLIVDGGKTLC